MPTPHVFLENLALVLCVAAVTTVVFQRLKQPVVFGYLLAGMLVGPHVQIPIMADLPTVRTLAEMGVILLMFSLGLEFSLRRLLDVGALAGLAALTETSVMMGLGYVAGQLLGWTTLESIFAGAIVAISSTTIIVKAFAEQDVRGGFRHIVFGMLIMEDLIAILLVAVLTAVAGGGGLSPMEFGITVVRLVTFLVGLAGIGILLVPRLMRYVVRLDRPETTLVATLGICFAASLLALTFGYSVALGAFIAGSLVSESGEEESILRLVLPVRDMFVAVFFVAVGMLIDPAVILENWVAVAGFTLLVVVGKVVAVSTAAFFTGGGLRPSVQSGMSMAQIGEFSFIIAAIGLAAGATRGLVYAVAVAVSAITTLLTPWLIKAANPVAVYVDRKLPKPVQTFGALYGSWLERLRASPERGGQMRIRRFVRLLLLDAALIAGLVIGAAAEMGRFTQMLVSFFGISTRSAISIVAGGGVLIAIPLLWGIVRTSRLLGIALAVRALPPTHPGRVDFARAPRGALVVALQLAIILVVITPLIAIIQPFLPTLPGFLLLVIVAMALGLAFWRSAKNLQGHARAGAQVIAAALADQLALSDEPDQLRQTMEHMHAVLPGLGEPVPVRVARGSLAAGRTLRELNLRGLTGATVLAIFRDGQQVLVPSGRETINAGDVLALAGTEEAIRGGRTLLEPAPPEPDTRSTVLVRE